MLRRRRTNGYVAATGATLGNIEHRFRLRIGDCWLGLVALFGGVRDITNAEDWNGPAYQICMDDGWVADKFEVLLAAPRACSLRITEKLLRFLRRG